MACGMYNKPIAPGTMCVDNGGIIGTIPVIARGIVADRPDAVVFIGIAVPVDSVSISRLDARYPLRTVIGIVMMKRLC